MPPVTVGPRPVSTPVVTPPVVAPATTPVTTPATPTTTPAAPAATFGGTTTTTPLPITPANIASGALTPMLARLGAMTGAPVDPSMLLALQDPAKLKATVENLAKALIASDGAALTPAHEKQIFGTLAKIEAAGQLDKALGMLADQAQAAGALPANIPPEKKAGLIAQFGFMLRGEMDARGVTPGSENKVFPSWNALSDKLLGQVRATSVPPKGPGNPSAFTNPAFIKEFEQLTGAKFQKGNDITPLIDGPASFKERDRMIDGAKKSIHLMTWAFYDDETGMGTAKKLIEKHKQGVDVKIMVDGNVARQPGHDKALALMEAAGIPVIRWNDPQRIHDGQHRKAMVVDGKEAVAGGLNFGDVYSHRGAADGQKWRDTDVLMKGSSVTQTERMFASIWNEQVQTRSLPLAKVDEKKIRNHPTEGGRASVINDTPGPDGNATILLATLKAIEGATKSVDIENAYFIQTPALRDALLKALERGVKVRILTNSDKSVDEPIVSAPIMNSLPELIEKGAEVYVKKGDTLHSKFMIVDGMYSQVGSYNLHPRSERYEGEMAVNSLDEKVAKSLGDAFAKDIAAAHKFNAASEVVVPKTAFSILASRLFFDQL